MEYLCTNTNSAYTGCGLIDGTESGSKPRNGILFKSSSAVAYHDDQSSGLKYQRIDCGFISH